MVPKLIKTSCGRWNVAIFYLSEACLVSQVEGLEEHHPWNTQACYHHQETLEPFLYTPEWNMFHNKYLQSLPGNMTHTHVHTHARTHACMHTHNHTHTHTHTHTCYHYHVRLFTHTLTIIKGSTYEHTHTATITTITHTHTHCFSFNI